MLDDCRIYYNEYLSSGSLKSLQIKTFQNSQLFIFYKQKLGLFLLYLDSSCCTICQKFLLFHTKQYCQLQQIQAIQRTSQNLIFQLQFLLPELSKFYKNAQHLISYNFRKTLQIFCDPLNLQFEKEQTAQANINTRIYKQIFACYPHDDIKKISDYEEFKANKKLEEYDSLKQFIKGHAVTFPLYFLIEENLNIKVTQKEYLAPLISFT